MDKQMHPAICAEMKKAFDEMEFPERDTNWAKVTLMVSQQCEMHVISGDRKTGEYDRPFVGFDRINDELEKLRSLAMNRLHEINFLRDGLRQIALDSNNADWKANNLLNGLTVSGMLPSNINGPA